MVELELLECGERPVALLEQLDLQPVDRARLVEAVARGRGLAQERACDEHDDEGGEHGAEGECERHHVLAAAAPS